MDIRLALMTGIDIPMPELQVAIHQPTITEISYMGGQDFFSAIHYLSINKETLVEDESLLRDLTNFQVLMKVIEQSDTQEKKIAITTLFSLLFPSYRTMITPNSIILTHLENNNTILIDSNNFDIFQSVLKEIFCINNMFQGDNVVYKPANAEAKRIAEKLMRGRKKAAEMKGHNNECVFSRYLSILTIGIPSMTLKDCLNLTVYQMFDLVERYTLFIDWDVDLRARLAGATPNSEVENWMKKIH